MKKKITDKEVSTEVIQILKDQYCALVDEHADKIIKKIAKDGKSVLRHEVTIEDTNLKLEFNSPKIKWSEARELNGTPAEIDLDDNLPIENEGSKIET